MLNRLKMFAILGIIMLGATFYEIIAGQIAWWLALSGLIIGLLIGLIYGNITPIVWNQEYSKVITKLDRTSFVIIIIYILFSISRKYLVRLWIHGPALLAFMFATTAGIMIGRLIVMSLRIEKRLRSQGLTKQ